VTPALQDDSPKLCACGEGHLAVPARSRGHLLQQQTEFSVQTAVCKTHVQVLEKPKRATMAQSAQVAFLSTAARTRGHANENFSFLLASVASKHNTTAV